MDQRCISLQERCRRGLLPLKKRRLSLPLEYEVASTWMLTSTSPPRRHSRFDTTMTTIPSKMVTLLCPRSDEPLTALASSESSVKSSIEFTRSQQMPLLPTIEHSKVPGSPGISLKARLLKAGAALQQQSSTHVDSGRPSQTDSSTSSSFEVLESGDATCANTGNHLSLTSVDDLAAAGPGPGPGGCHGKTSRSSSYCRRQGNYKGSNYCKLHYHLYVGRGHKRQRRNHDSGSSTDLAASTAAASNSSTEPFHHQQQQQQQALADSSNNNNKKGTAVATSSQQDKRFTGAAGEICCQATTTRGRPCAFVAVDGTKFCNLHSSALSSTSSSSSSSNKTTAIATTSRPVPRRGKVAERGSSSGDVSAADSLLLLLGADSGDTSNDTNTIRSSSSSPSASTPPIEDGPGLVSPANTSMVLPMQDVPAPESSGKQPSIVRNSSKRAAKYADSPHPLLSKIPVDQWFGKTVKIVCGPMANKVGTVEKWGNGWITVRIPEVGAHNRRSFELYVVPEVSPVEEQATKSSGPRFKARPSSTLRSTVSPSPSSESGSSSNKQCLNIVNNVSYSYDCDDTPRMFETSISAVVLDTPQPKRELVGAFSNGQGEEQEVAETPIPNTTSVFGVFPERNGQGQGGQQHKIVTPLSPRRARTELPLSDSLVLAQEGAAKKYRIDMLFGTAALERSRRSIHRPSRFENSSK